MKNSRRRPPGDALDPLGERLRQALSMGGPDGVDPEALADIAEQEFPDLAALLARAHLVEWVHKVRRRWRGSNGLPLAGSFKGKLVQIDFWDLDMFRTAVEHYVSPARKNLAIARGLAQECERIHRVRITVPGLTDDLQAEAI